MKNINVNQLLKVVEKYGFKSTDQHWRCGESQKCTRQIMKKILEFNSQGVKLTHKVTCPYDDCLNPDCYELKYYNRTSAFLDQEDFYGVVETINYNECLSMGMKKYLEKYNEDKIDLLKITMRQLSEVMTYLGGRR